MAIRRWGWHAMWMATAALGACNGAADFVSDEEVCRDACVRIAEGHDCLDMAGNSLGACEEGLICGFTTRRCMTPVGAGEACPTYTECTAGLLCVNGTCEAPAAVGAACAGKFACAEGAYCDERGVCRARAELGEVCVDSAGCAAGGYCDSTRVCAALPAVCASP